MLDASNAENRCAMLDIFNPYSRISPLCALEVTVLQDYLELSDRLKTCRGIEPVSGWWLLVENIREGI